MYPTIIDYFQRTACFFSLSIEEEQSEQLCIAEERFSLETAAKTGLLFACLVPLIALCAGYVRKALSPRYTNEERAHLTIESFWKLHVNSFALNHGTTALYYRHFQEHGISSSYPPALEEIIEKIRSVWKNHETDICPCSQYFEWFEERYDEAFQNKKIAVSFSAQQMITSEFTTGARRGGEWIREVRHFLREAYPKLGCLSAEEKQTVLKMEALVDVIDTVSPMVVTIRPSCEEIRPAFHNSPLLSPLSVFLSYVKNSCKNWQDSASLSHYLKQEVLPQLERLKQEYERQYEITVDREILAKHLEFTFIENSKKEELSCSYPRLQLDQATPLSQEEISLLQIERTGFTDIAEYRDSRFFCEYLAINSEWIVTRKTLTQKDLQDLALRNEKREMRKQWVKVFACEDRVQCYL